MNGGDPIDRRGFLALGAGLVLGAAGCKSTASSRSPAQSDGTSTSGASDAPAPQPAPSASTSTPTSTARLPTVQAWRPDAGDLEPAVKLVATQVVEAIGNWTVRGHGTRAAASRIAALGQTGGLVTEAGSLLGDAPSAALQVVEAQYGGLLSASASVLVVCRQWRTGPGGALTGGGTTIDVRLRKTAGRWHVTALRPARPGPPTATLSTLARRVLAERQITLPPASMADIRSGHVHDSVLTALLTLARSYRIDVSVLRSGHPTYVFGTGRLSDHPRGRAFDTWRVNGQRVVDPATSRQLVASYMRAAASASSYNVGGPVQLSGVGNQFFTNPTHHDHVHVGFDH
ncbi:MAG: hypothetical protein ACR2KG_12370 [Nocardioidaceae bacterium]